MPLSLTRKEKEKIKIVVPASDKPTLIDLQVTWVSNRERSCRLAFEADQEVKIDREEIYDRKRANEVMPCPKNENNST